MWSAGATEHELCEALPRYSSKSNRLASSRPKFLRPEKPPVNSGHPVINQIKERARYLNISMGDVDAMAGTKKYVCAAQWVSTGRPNLKAVGKAILALDGEVTAIWH